MKMRLFLIVLVTTALRGDVLYVSQEGDGSTGESWATAYQSLQEALDVVESNTTVYVAGGVWTVAPIGSDNDDSTMFRLQNASGVMVRGGYEGATDLLPQDHPGAWNPELWPTVLSSASEEARVMTLLGVTDVVLAGFTICNGMLKPSTRVNRYGGGVYMTGCEGVVIDGCVITNNYVGTHVPYGGGVSVVGSSAIITNCLIADNFSGGVGWNTTGQGGGVYVSAGSEVLVTRSQLLRNKAHGTASGNGSGGGVYVAANGKLTLRESVVACNETTRTYPVQQGLGAGVANYGKLDVRNSVIVANKSQSLHSDGVLIGGGEAVLVNVTIADNYSVGVRYMAGMLAITNAIIWGHDADLYDLPTDIAGNLPGLWYSCVGAGVNMGVQGCITMEPGFTDDGFYHLQSAEGCYKGGYFSGGVWGVTETTSSLLDRGDPGADYILEPLPNGGRVNMGAYGNTAVASLTPDIVVVPAVITNSGAALWGHRGAFLEGEVINDGGHLPDLFFDYWLTGSVESNTFALGPGGGFVSVPLKGLMPGVAYSYQMRAVNLGGETISTVAEFSTLPLGADIYVSTQGSNTAGRDWTSAYTNLHEALAVIEAGDSLYLAGQEFRGKPSFGTLGVYTLENLRDITIRGGYEADLAKMDLPGAQDSEQWPTTLARAGEVAYARVFYIDSVVNLTIESVTIRDGLLTSALQSPQGAGIYFTKCEGVILCNCKVAGNTASIYSSSGGGIYLNASELVINGCEFTGNSVKSSNNDKVYGGGVCVDKNSTAMVVGSYFNSNLAQGGANGSAYGGALYVAAGGKLTIGESLLTKNTSKRGYAATYGFGGAVASSGELWIRNTIITENQSDATNPHSDGVYVGGGVARIDNATIVDNKAVGIYYGGGVIGVTNSIVCGHGEDLVGFPVNESGHTEYVGYSLFDIPAEMEGVNGCIAGDPGFVDRTNGDYRLLNSHGGGEPEKTSRAVDAGVNCEWMQGAVDFGGKPRVRQGLSGGGVRRVDIGAHEADPPYGTVLVIK